jgi:hypothetical protein
MLSFRHGAAFVATSTRCRKQTCDAVGAADALIESRYVCQAASNAAICVDIVHQATAAMLATSMAVAADCANAYNDTYKGQYVWATI